MVDEGSFKPQSLPRRPKKPRKAAAAPRPAPAQPTYAESDYEDGYDGNPEGPEGAHNDDSMIDLDAPPPDVNDHIHSTLRRLRQNKFRASYGLDADVKLLLEDTRSGATVFDAYGAICAPERGERHPPFLRFLKLVAYSMAGCDLGTTRHALRKQQCIRYLQLLIGSTADEDAGGAADENPTVLQAQRRRIRELVLQEDVLHRRMLARLGEWRESSPSYAAGKRLFETCREWILTACLPKSYKRRFDQIVFFSWQQHQRPGIVVSPFAIPPGWVRNQWYRSLFAWLHEQKQQKAKLMAKLKSQTHMSASKKRKMLALLNSSTKEENGGGAALELPFIVYLYGTRPFSARTMDAADQWATPFYLVSRQQLVSYEQGMRAVADAKSTSPDASRQIQLMKLDLDKPPHKRRASYIAKVPEGQEPFQEEYDIDPCSGEYPTKARLSNGFQHDPQVAALLKGSGANSPTPPGAASSKSAAAASKAANRGRKSMLRRRAAADQSNKRRCPNNNQESMPMMDRRQLRETMDAAEQVIIHDDPRDAVDPAYLHRNAAASEGKGSNHSGGSNGGPQLRPRHSLQDQLHRQQQELEHQQQLQQHLIGASNSLRESLKSFGGSSFADELDAEADEFMQKESSNGKSASDDDNNNNNNNNTNGGSNNNTISGGSNHKGEGNSEMNFFEPV